MSEKPTDPYNEAMPDDDTSRDDSPVDEKSSAAALLQPENGALEAQQKVDTEAPVEYTVSSTKKLVCLGLYFLLNLGMTLSNKSVMQTARYPWTLTTIHAATTSIGCAGLLRAGWFQLTRLDRKEHLILVAFSTLFTINIAISNVSLYVSTSLMKVARSLCPAATILIYRFVYARTYSQQTYLTMVPLIFGVGLTTYGDYNFTLVGFLLTFFGVFLSAIKAVASNRLMTGTLKLSAFEILFRMSPLAAAQCLVYAWGSGELYQIQASIAKDGALLSRSFLIVLASNAATAFFLNVSSFYTNKVAGALTISVCSNVKQSLTILLGVVLFSVKVTLLNGIGMVITMAGAAWYSKVELDSKRAKALQQGGR